MPKRRHQENQLRSRNCQPEAFPGLKLRPFFSGELGEIIDWKLRLKATESSTGSKIINRSEIINWKLCLRATESLTESEIIDWGENVNKLRFFLRMRRLEGKNLFS